MSRQCGLAFHTPITICCSDAASNRWWNLISQPLSGVCSQRFPVNNSRMLRYLFLGTVGWVSHSAYLSACAHSAEAWPPLSLDPRWKILSTIDPRLELPPVPIDHTLLLRLVLPSAMMSIGNLHQSGEKVPSVSITDLTFSTTSASERRPAPTISSASLEMVERPYEYSRRHHVRTTSYALRRHRLRPPYCCC